MDDALRVRRREHVEHLVDDSEQLRLGQAAEARRALLERLALEQLHHEERAAVFGDVDVADLHGARV